MPPPRALVGLVVGTALALGTAACSEPPPRTSLRTGIVGDRTAELTVWLGPQDSLHPQDTSPHLAAAIATPLVATDPASRLPTWGPDVPGALLSAISSPDLQRWELTITEGRRWADGTPITAADLVRGWERSIDRGVPLLSTVEGLRAVDDRTVAVRLTAPFGQLPLLLGDQAFLPVHPEAAEDQPIGDGPYAVVETSDDRLVLALVADHPLAADGAATPILVDTTREPGPDVDVAVGDDGQPTPPAGIGAANRPALVRAPGRQLAHLGLPLDEPAFADVDVRTALSLSLDVPAIAADVAGDAVIPADRLIGPGLPRDDDVTCAACRHDPERARQLWGDGIDGPLTLWFASDGGHDELVDAVAGAWREVLGVEDIQLASEPGADLLGRLADGDVTGPFRLTWQADVPAAVRVLEPLFASQGAANDVRLRDEAIDDLLARAGGERDLDDSLAGYAAVEQAVLDEVAVIPLWFSTIPLAASADVTGVGLDGAGRLDWTALGG
ncbi:ABC transporter substrate-binding protein [Euzebya sp.]|uniref:peptide ABC transporter substrate-binding protein n=1 Tax=Euzebya sp. TaxID=1971409 RepID=UPI003514D9A9